MRRSIQIRFLGFICFPSVCYFVYLAGGQLGKVGQHGVRDGCMLRASSICMAGPYPDIRSLNLPQLTSVRVSRAGVSV